MPSNAPSQNGYPQSYPTNVREEVEFWDDVSKTGVVTGAGGGALALAAKAGVIAATAGPVGVAIGVTGVGVALIGGLFSVLAKF